MNEPTFLADATRRFSLPFLHPGQARKEVFVNEAFAVTDALLHCCVRGEAALPPPDSPDGEVWLVGPDAAGEWTGRDTQIAIRRGGAWVFQKPCEGMRVFNAEAGQEYFYRQIWKKAAYPGEPLGGFVVDEQARAAITKLLAILQSLGIIPSA